MASPRAITIAIAALGAAILAFGGVLAAFEDTFFSPGYGGSWIVALVGVVSVILAPSFLVLMCFPSNRSPAAIVIGVLWIIPLLAAAWWLISPWLTLALIAPALITCGRVYFARERPDNGKCLHCGYDLVGLPDRAPCPECGTSVR